MQCNVEYRLSKELETIDIGGCLGEAEYVKKFHEYQKHIFTCKICRKPFNERTVQLMTELLEIE